MFDNLTIYRVAPSWEPKLDALEIHQFHPCLPSQERSVGLVPVTGPAGGLVEHIADALVLRVMVETRSVPAQVLARRAEELGALSERETGRKPGRGLRAEHKEQARLELLPRAFPRRTSVHCWIDLEARLLALGTASGKLAELVATTLVRALDGLALGPLQTKVSPAQRMGEWASSGSAADPFYLGVSVGLSRHSQSVKFKECLDDEYTRELVTAGFSPTQVDLEIPGRGSFTLTGSGVIKGIKLVEKAEDDYSGIYLGVTETRMLILQLVEALGGEA